MAVATISRAIRFVIRIAHFLAGDAREEPGVLHESSHVFKQIVREVLDFLLFRFDIVVEEIDPETFGQLFVDGVVDEAAILGSDCLLSCIVGFRQIEAVYWIGVFLE